MAIDPTAASATGATTADTKSGKAQNKLASDMDTFLLMLTTQLRNQDPLSPMDSSEFTNQLVQFAAVEQQIDVNANLERMIQMQHLSQMSSSVGYLGTAIEFDSALLPLQDEKASFTYTLDESAEEVTIRIADPVTGDVLRTIKGESKAGLHSVQWNGLDDGGQALPEGPYKVTVSARSGQVATTVPTTVTGTVTGVTAGDGNVILSIAGVDVTLDSVKSIKQPASPASGA